MQIALRNSALCGLLLLALNASTSAHDLNQDEALRLRQAGLTLPLEQLLELALQHYPGATLLEAELEEEDDILVY